MPTALLHPAVAFTIMENFHPESNAGWNLYRRDESASLPPLGGDN